MLKKVLNYRQTFVLIQGFSSGFPLLVTLGVLQAWMTDVKVDLGVIGLMSSVTIPYSLKFLWSPLMDRFNPGFLSRRRAWIFITQVLTGFSIILLGQMNPGLNLWAVAACAFLVTFFSASQDIVIDAYRREILQHEELGLGSSIAIAGYRWATLLASGGSLAIADYLQKHQGMDPATSWRIVYFALGFVMLLLSLTTWFAPMESSNYGSPKNLKESVLGPLKDFFTRDGAWIILGFVLLYKVGDTMASTLTTPFILDIGYSKTELAAIVKVWGFTATMIGMFLGGVILVKLDIYKSLWIFGVLQAISTYGFGLLTLINKNLVALSGVIAFENIAGGMGMAAYAAYMANLTNRKFTATQYALLSALMAVPRNIVSAPTGYLAKTVGWHQFFLICALAAIPGMLLLFKVAPWSAKVPEGHGHC